MLQITKQQATPTRVTYRLAGEITLDQISRLEGLATSVLQSGRALTLDISDVWRVDRMSTELIASLWTFPGSRVRLEGADEGLLAWLRTVSSEQIERGGHTEGGTVMEALSRHWGWIVLRGVVAILFGVLTMFHPGITLAALVLLFGAYALADGVLTVVWAIQRRHHQSDWVVSIFGGLLGVGVGVVTFLTPAITALALLLLIAGWAILTGGATIVAAIRLRKVLTGEWRLVVVGLLAVALGVLLIAAPGAGALSMVLWIGAYAVVSGILLVALGFRVRSWGRVAAAPLVSRRA